MVAMVTGTFLGSRS